MKTQLHFCQFCFRVLAEFTIRINDPPAEISRGSATFTAKPSLVSTEECFPPFKCIKCATQRPNVQNPVLFQYTLAETRVTYLFINKAILQHLPTYITFLLHWKVKNAQWGWNDMINSLRELPTIDHSFLP